MKRGTHIIIHFIFFKYFFYRRGTHINTYFIFFKRCFTEKLSKTSKASSWLVGEQPIVLREPSRAPEGGSSEDPWAGEGIAAPSSALLAQEFPKSQLEWPGRAQGEPGARELLGAGIITSFRYYLFISNNLFVISLLFICFKCLALTAGKTPSAESLGVKGGTVGTRAKAALPRPLALRNPFFPQFPSCSSPPVALLWAGRVTRTNTSPGVVEFWALCSLWVDRGALGQ